MSNTKPLSFRLSDQERIKLKQIAEKKGVSQVEVLRGLIDSAHSLAFSPSLPSRVEAQALD